MVEEINATQVDIDERLSNQVYHYDRLTRKLSMATDTPNKSLTSEKDIKGPEMTRQFVRQEAMMDRPELTMEDIVTLVNAFEGEFIIHIEAREVEDDGGTE